MGENNQNKMGYILVIVIFLISFIEGGFLLNKIIVDAKLSDNKSQIQNFKIKNDLRNLDEFTFHELYQAQVFLTNHEDKNLINYFADIENNKIWQLDTFNQNLESNSKYKILEIKLNNKLLELNNITSLKSTIESKFSNIKNLELEINLIKKVKYESKFSTKYISYVANIIVIYYSNNFNIFLPDEERINQIEVYENETI